MLRQRINFMKRSLASWCAPDCSTCYQIYREQAMDMALECRRSSPGSHNNPAAGSGYKAPDRRLVTKRRQASWRQETRRALNPSSTTLWSELEDFTSERSDGTRVRYHRWKQPDCSSPPMKNDKNSRESAFIKTHNRATHRVTLAFTFCGNVAQVREPLLKVLPFIRATEPFPAAIIWLIVVPEVYGVLRIKRKWRSTGISIHLTSECQTICLMIIRSDFAFYTVFLVSRRFVFERHTWHWATLICMPSY